MQTSIDQTHWYDRIWAAFIFFTRLPFWRLHQPPQASYKTVVEHWPLAGWLTGGVMAATLYVGSMYLPYIVAVLLAIIVRLLVTGALHEDGLADFLDGFGGGGHDRERILAIMKDSHIGTYGVLGLILYEVLLAACLFSLPLTLAALTILAADPYAKMVTAQLILMMAWELIIFLPCLTMYFLYLLIWNRLRGYTGDCCGAVCLLVELTVYLVVCAL